MDPGYRRNRLVGLLTLHSSSRAAVTCLKRGGPDVSGETLGIKADWCEGAVLHTLYKHCGFLQVGSAGHASCVVGDQSEGGSSCFLRVYEPDSFSRSPSVIPAGLSLFRWFCDTYRQQCLLSCR